LLKRARGKATPPASLIRSAGRWPPGFAARAPGERPAKRVRSAFEPAGWRSLPARRSAPGLRPQAVALVGRRRAGEARPHSTSHRLPAPGRSVPARLRPGIGRIEQPAPPWDRLRPPQEDGGSKPGAGLAEGRATGFTAASTGRAPGREAQPTGRQPLAKELELGVDLPQRRCLRAPGTGPLAGRRQRRPCRDRALSSPP